MSALNGCQDCRFAVSTAPALCGLHRDYDTGLPKLCQQLRGALGVCGPDGVFWSPCIADGDSRSASRPPSAVVVIAFPQAHRVSA